MGNLETAEAKVHFEKVLSVTQMARMSVYASDGPESVSSIANCMWKHVTACLA